MKGTATCAVTESDAHVAGRLAQLFLLSAVTLATTFCRFEFGSIQEAMQRSLALTDTQVAWLQGPATAVPMALAAIPLGLIVYRLPRRPLFFGIILAALAGIGIAASAPNLLVLAAARSITGLAIAASLVAAYAMVCDIFGPAQRGRAMMVLTLSEVIAGPAAFALGGILLTLSISQGSAHWRSALLWMGVPLVPILPLTLLIRTPSQSLPRADVAAPDNWRGLWRYRAVIGPLLLARTMVWIADGAVLIWGAPTFARQYQLSPGHVGAILGSSLLIAGLAGPLLGGPLADLLYGSGGPRRAMIALAALSFLSVAGGLFPIMPDPSLAAVFLTAFLATGYIIAVIATALVTIVIPETLRPVYLGLSITVGAVFSIGVAPLVVSWLTEFLQGTLASALAIVCIIASLLTSLIFAGSRSSFPPLHAPNADSGSQDVPSAIASFEP